MNETNIAYMHGHANEKQPCRVRAER